MSDVEPISFVSEGVEIHGSLWKADGPASGVVVFCHGAFETSKNWAAFAEKLSQDGFTSLTFDFAGHGQSQGLRGQVNLRGWTYNIRDALINLQELGYPAAGLVGWDSGGSAALLAAAHDKHARCAVILSAPVYLLPTLAERVAYGLASLVAKLKLWILHKPLTLSRLNEMKGLGILADETANEAYFEDHAVQEIYKAVPIPESLDSVWMDITGTVQKVNVPVLVVQGVEDKIIPINQAQKLYDLLPGRKEIKMVEGCGHAIHLDIEKDAVYELILNWMKANLKK